MSEVTVPREASGVSDAGWSVVTATRPDTDLNPAASAGLLASMAAGSLGALADLELSKLDPSALATLADEIERVRRMADSMAASVAQQAERTKPFADHGFFATKNWLRHRLQLSGPEAFRRVQTAHLHDRLTAWAGAARAGQVGVAQTRLMARIAANPRIPDHLLQRDQGLLLDDARTLPFDEFERRARSWEALADPRGDRADAHRQHEARSVQLRARPEGGWTLSGTLDELAGSEFAEVFGHFVEAEWHSDWTEARGRLGHAATTADLRRSAGQRQADALLAIARRAASAEPGLQGRPTVNVLIDLDTFEASLHGDEHDPRRYRQVVCRTQAGRRLSRDDAVNAALVGHVRRAVFDSSATVIDLGYRSRCFRGSAREAVTLGHTQCVWLGCDQPIQWCDADHSLRWGAHGATVPRNGQPLCRRHNLLKERGFQVYRDDQGEWHFIDPNGTPIS